MDKKVKYERRNYRHDCSPPDNVEAAFLALNPLEQICSDLGGIRVDQTVEENDELGNTGSLTYIVAKRNGVAAFVKIEIVDASNGDVEDCIRQTTVFNVEKHEHQGLLAALHTFYDGTPGYNGMDGPNIIERKIKP